MQALAGLTRLRSISISSWDFAVCPAPLFEALQGLSCLTSLAVSRVTGTSKLRYLPQGLLLLDLWGLLSLDLGVCSNGICLTHLTQLTALRTDKLFSLESGDLLPASLRQLEIGEINSVQRLVGLTALRSLSAYASNVPQLRLHRVARSLSQLTRVQLCYKSDANEAAAAWPLLPLQHLELQEVDALTTAALQLTTLQQISCLTKLTYLHIQRLDAVQAGTWEIASVLRHLTQLRGLRLWAAGPWPQHRGQQQQQQQHAAPAAALMAGTTGVCMVDPTQPDAGSPAGMSEGCAWSVQRVQQQVEARERRQSTAADGDADVAAAANSAVGAAAAAGSQGCCKASLTAVIAALPHLNRLSLSLQGLGTSAAAELGAATGLTWLKLRACGIDSAALAGLASELKGLRSLFVEYNREVGDEVLPVLLRELTALTELDVRYTGVSGAGGQHLQTMTRLQQLQL
ncbi:hypothetical protein COO60DRAFT_1647860 [Scenedesmus sp. NREL 46B-D3]|nr:hypothetical protein COO60DRAFT_1647860 [Scenedesmus sp. NREL 46B-D3]